MYRLGSYKGVTGVFFRFFEMFFPGHAISRQNKGFKEGVQRFQASLFYAFPYFYDFFEMLRCVYKNLKK